MCCGIHVVVYKLSIYRVFNKYWRKILNFKINKWTISGEPPVGSRSVPDSKFFSNKLIFCVNTYWRPSRHPCIPPTTPVLYQELFQWNIKGLICTKSHWFFGLNECSQKIARYKYMTLDTKVLEFGPFWAELLHFSWKKQVFCSFTKQFGDFANILH